MKHLPNIILKLLLFLGTGYLLSHIITREVVTVISLLTAISVVRRLFSFAFSLVFVVIKWACIIGGIALIFSII